MTVQVWQWRDSAIFSLLAPPGRWHIGITYKYNKQPELLLNQTTALKYRKLFESLWLNFNASGYHRNVSDTILSARPLRKKKEAWGLVSSCLANAFWLPIYLISFNRSVIEIHQKFLSVHSPLLSAGLQHLFRLYYWGSSLSLLMLQSDRALVTEIINFNVPFTANALIYFTCQLGSYQRRVLHEIG